MDLLFKHARSIVSTFPIVENQIKYTLDSPYSIVADNIIGKCKFLLKLNSNMST
jgi:hypothetical protein